MAKTRLLWYENWTGNKIIWPFKNRTQILPVFTCFQYSGAQIWDVLYWNTVNIQKPDICIPEAFNFQTNWLPVSEWSKHSISDWVIKWLIRNSGLKFPIIQFPVWKLNGWTMDHSISGLDIKTGLKNWPFNCRTSLRHLITRLVWFSDLYCSLVFEYL